MTIDETTQERCYVLKGHKPCRKIPEKPCRRSELVSAVVGEVLNGACRGEVPWPVFLHGDVGSGKTCAALCVVDFYGGWYTTEAEFCDDLRRADQGELWTSGFRRYPNDEWRSWFMCHVAVIDELGSRTESSDFRCETVQRMIDDRAGKALIVCSNLGLEQVAQTLNDRIASRLSAGTVIKTTGDRRVRQEKIS